MRVAYICADAGIPVFGRKGCSIHVQEFLCALARQGAEIRLFATRCEGTPPAGLQALRSCQLCSPFRLVHGARMLDASATNQELKEVLEREGPFDLVYERYSLYSFSGMEYAQASGLPAVLEVNAPLIEEQSQYRHLDNREAAEGAARRVFRAASVLIAVSDEVADYLNQYPEARGRVEVVANGVDPDRFAPRSESGASHADAFTVGFVGSLKPWHGVPDLLEAFAVLRELASGARLLIVGDGPERPRLEQNLAARGLVDAVSLTGSVSHCEVPELLTSMDVAVAPYPKLANFYFSP